MRFATNVILWLCLAALSACDKPEPLTPRPTTQPDQNPPTFQGEFHPVGTVSLFPSSPPAYEAARNRRRMDVDQLNRAIRTVSGGIGWTEQRGQTEVDLFEELSTTLGKPNFLDVTEEDLEPSAMFQKFLDDAARSVCTKLRAEDAARPEAERIFFVGIEPVHSLSRKPTQVKAMLRAVLHRFHGRKLTNDSPELEPWLWLLQSTEHVAEDQSEVWQTLCVGLFTHPDFYTY